MGQTSVCDCSPFGEEKEKRNIEPNPHKKQNAFQFDDFIQFQQFVKNAIIMDNMSDALRSCEQRGIPLIVRIEDANNVPKMDDDDGRSTVYMEVEIHGQKQVTTQKKQTTKVKWNDDLLFIIPFKSMDKILNYNQNNHMNGVTNEYVQSTLTITFRLFQRDAFHMVSYMSENTLLMADMDITPSKISGNAKSEMDMTLKVEYTQSTGQIDSVDAVIPSPMLGLFDGALAMDDMTRNKTESVWSSASPVTEPKKNVCIGQLKLHMDLLQEHKGKECGTLQYVQSNKVYNALDTTSTEMTYKVFLNAITVYKELKDNHIWPCGLEML
eukprot:765778_1